MEQSEEHRADDFGGMPRLKEWIVGRYQYHDRVGGYSVWVAR